MRAGYNLIVGCWALLSACTPLDLGLVDEPVNLVAEYIIGPGDTVNVFCLPLAGAQRGGAGTP